MPNKMIRATTERRWTPLPDAFALNGQDLPARVFRLRKKLYIKAKQEPRFRFYALYDWIYRSDTLRAAWETGVDQQGCAGRGRGDDSVDPRI